MGTKNACLNAPHIPDVYVLCVMLREGMFGLYTFILGSPALLRDCVEEEAEMTPEPLAELRSLPKDSEEPRPEVEDMDPDPEDSELCRGLFWLCPSLCFLPSGGGCSLNLKGDI